MIQLSKELDEKLLGYVMKCDLALGYRLTHRQYTRDGNPRSEDIFDDYRIVDGVPFPLRQVSRFFDETGTKVMERKLMFCKVEFDVEIPDREFSISVPAGTRLTDLIKREFRRTLDKAQVVSFREGDDSLEVALELPDSPSRTQRPR